MDRTIKTTSDGSKTLHVSALDETYHSHHGALQEAKHVFIENGLKQLNLSEINILELGFGTGLNALVTIDEFLKNKNIHNIQYFTMEKYPVNAMEIAELDYAGLFSAEKMNAINEMMHSCPWGKSTEIVPGFFLTKIKEDFFNLDQVALPAIDLVYFDCFGARVQPDLWEEELLSKVSNKMGAGALFTTYSSKGSVRRILKSLDLTVEKMAGPPGKREMLNAWKKQN